MSKKVLTVDDASRICCHGQFFAEENSPAFKVALKRAFYKRGLPQMLYVDNGSIYSSAELTAICNRLGVRLCHTPVRDGAAKGKVERFFRTVRDQFLVRQLDLSSIDELCAISSLCASSTCPASMCSTNSLSHGPRTNTTTATTAPWA